jgi:hypothetical protein
MEPQNTTKVNWPRVFGCGTLAELSGGVRGEHSSRPSSLFKLKYGTDLHSCMHSLALQHYLVKRRKSLDQRCEQLGGFLRREHIRGIELKELGLGGLWLPNVFSDQSASVEIQTLPRH